MKTSSISDSQAIRARSRSTEDLRKSQIMSASNLLSPTADGDRSLSGKSQSSTRLAAGAIIPDVVEERVGVVVSKKGYMQFLEEKTQGWIKR